MSSNQFDPIPMAGQAPSAAPAADPAESSPYRDAIRGRRSPSTT